MNPFVQVLTQDQNLNRIQANISQAFNLLFNQFSIPIGSVVFYAGLPKDQGNWLVCNGRTLTQASYQALFAVIGITYGSIGIGMFSLPTPGNFGASGTCLIKYQ